MNWKTTEFLVFADFETTQPFLENGQKKVAVYLWAFLTSWDKKYYRGTTLQGFFTTIFALKKSVKIYFHNGGKFDFHFFKEILSSDNFTQKYQKSDTNLLKRETRHEFIDYKTKNKGLLKEFEFELICNDRKKIIEIKLASPFWKYSTYKNKSIKKNYIIQFRDSAQLFLGTLKNYGEMVGKSQKIEFKGFLEIKERFINFKHFKSRVKNWKKHEVYIKRDCLILKNFLLEMSKILPPRDWKTTIASTAYNFFLAKFPTTFFNLAQKFDMKPWRRTNSKGFTFYYLGKKRYKVRPFCEKILNQLFPTSWMDEIENNRYVFENINQFYRGGLTTFNSDFQAVEIFEPTNYYDINSSYSSIMTNSKIPIGAPVENGDYQLLQIRAKKTIKLLGGVAFLPQKIKSSSGYKLNYPSKIKKDSEFFLTSPEFELVKKYYSEGFSVKKWYSFNTIESKYLFSEYVNHFWNLKTTAKSAVSKFFAKIMLNALYGKFGQKNIQEGHILHEGEWIKNVVIRKTKKYLPIASAITSLGRAKLINAIAFEKNWIYADTDSLILPSKISPNFEIGENLGQWKIEFANTNWLFVRTRKQYGFSTEKTQKLTFAGLTPHPEKIDIGHPWNKSNPMEGVEFSRKTIIEGGEFSRQLRPHHLRSGVFLQEFSKKIKPVWSPEYSYSPECWFYPRNEIEKIPHQNRTEFIKKIYDRKLKNHLTKINNRLKLI